MLARLLAGRSSRPCAKAQLRLRALAGAATTHAPALASSGRGGGERGGRASSKAAAGLAAGLAAIGHAGGADGGSASAWGRAPAFEDDYELCERLGAGAYGVVHRAKERKTGRQVAVKIIRRRRASEDAVRNEVAVLQRVGLHRGVSRLDAFYETADSFYMVMEYISGGVRGAARVSPSLTRTP
jgi:serine/threonine protein kinase